MKTIILVLPLLLTFASCISSVKITALHPSIQGGIGRTAILRLPPSSYTIRHNMAAIRSLNFAYLSEQALDRAISGRRKAWKMVPATTINATGIDAVTSFAAHKEDLNGLTSHDTARFVELSVAIDTRYAFIIENISLKDVSTQQAPASLVAGACLQLWDIREVRLVYRARDVSRPVNYGDEKFNDRLNEALEDLFEDLLAPLPKK